MLLDRKKKLKRKVEKRSKEEARKLAIWDRLITTMGLKTVFHGLPDRTLDVFLRGLRPGIEVIATPDSRDEPEIREALREITALVKRPLKSVIRGRQFEVALEDLIRGHDCIVDGVKAYLSILRQRHEPDLRRVYLLMAEAQKIVDHFDRDWLQDVQVKLFEQLFDVIDSYLHIDGRTIDARTAQGRKPEGRACPQIELRLVKAAPHVVSYHGSHWTTFPCRRPWGSSGLRHTQWNCKRLGIEGPAKDLPVYIEKHAIARLHERLPLEYESLLHHLMIDSLDDPVLVPIAQEMDKHLVEARLGKHRVGYFVVQILPQLVLVKTFLFLTMQGTPEAEKLRNKLGLHRKDVEHYRLDQFFTLVASDIANDPLLVRVLSECGCGHLASLIDPGDRFQWLDRFGERLKRSFDIREAREGFMVGQKWIKWSD
jgi:hypothetical protein